MANFYEIAKYDYVLFTDTVDVVLQKCPTDELKKMIQKMEAENIDMIFNSEPYSWPEWAVKK